MNIGRIIPKKWTIRKLQQWEVQWRLSSLMRTIQQEQGNLATPTQLLAIHSLETQLGD